MTKIELTTSGIYRISCKATGKQYIGNSQHIGLRLASHLTALRSGTHFNASMQNDWEVFGAEAFEFEIIEIITDRAERYRRESTLLRDSGLREILYNAQGDSCSDSGGQSTTFSLRISKSLCAILEQAAKREHRTVNNLITKILAEWAESQSQAE